VQITGFLNQSQISRAYVAADILVLPSSESETWGLVVNEGMNFGLAIVVSDKVGCGADLVIHGENGFVVPSSSVSALADALRRLVGDRERCSQYGKRSCEIVDAYDVRHTANDVVDAVLASACHGRMRSGRLRRVGGVECGIGNDGPTT
jgi:glycosyltransferase involved in cell wall biosynthesis